MFNALLLIGLVVAGIYLVYAVANALEKNSDDGTTGDSGLNKSDYIKASVDSEFKVEEPTKVKAAPIDPAIVDDLTEEKPAKKKAAKKPAAKKRTTSKKKAS